MRWLMLAWSVLLLGSLTWRPSGSEAEGLQSLLAAMEGAGAQLTHVSVVGWSARFEPGSHAEAELLRLKASLPEGASLSVDRSRPGASIAVTARLSLESSAVGDWVRLHKDLTAALAHTQGTAGTAVQLEGIARGVLPAEAVRKALDAVRASSREPWEDEKAVSEAGHSPWLPQGPLPVNVQAAARLVEGDQVRVLVAWPALQGEY